MDSANDIGIAVCLILFTCLTIFVFRKLLENRKRKAINTSLAKSGHYWSPVEFADRSFYCVSCTSQLTSGYECDYCNLKVDGSTCLRNISTTILCKVNHTTEFGSDLHHHWIPGNLEADEFCCICQELCGDGVGIQDFRCSWCQRVVHTRCREELRDQLCDLGELRQTIIPPQCVMTRKPGNRNQRMPVIDSLKIPEDIEGWSPVVVLVNPKSGSGAGKKVLRVFRNVLNPVQVVDVTKSNMTSVLKWIDEYPDVSNVRVVIAGGDGTISLVLDDLDKLQRPPPVAILPLGTGNDLSRVLGWGAESNGGNIVKKLKQIHDAKVQNMDRWTINIENTRKLGIRPSSKTLSMTNYVSIGVDACVTFGMQTTRESIPKALSSRFLNKLLFFTYGTKDVIARECRGLNQNIDLYLDDRKIDLPDIEGLIFLNIACWGAGVKPWSSAPDDWNQAIDDGKFEVFAVTSSFHIAQLQIGISSPILIGQASKAVLKVRKGPWPMQSDGEAWQQQPATLTISHKGVTPMLERNQTDSKSSSKSCPKFY